MQQAGVGFNFKTVGLARHIMTQATQDHARLVHGGLQLVADTSRFAEKRDARVHAILLQVDRDGYQDIVVAALAESRALLLADSDHLVGQAVHTDLFPDRVRAGEQIVDHVGANDGHARAGILVGVVEHAAARQVNIQNGRHRGRNATDGDTADRLQLVLHVSGAISLNRAYRGTIAASLEHGAVVLHGQVLALHAFHVLIEVGDDGRHLTDNENVRPQIEDLLRHIAVDAVDEGNDGDDRRDADDHAQQREDRAQLIGP